MADDDEEESDRQPLIPSGHRLTEAERGEAVLAMQTPGDDTQLIIRVGVYGLTRKDFRTLRPKQWLNDQVS